MENPTFLKRHPVAAYFILAYAISWLIWTPLVASAQGWLDTQIPAGVHFLGAFGPLLAALIVTGSTGSVAGLRELVGRMVRWRVGLGWFLIALFSPALLFLLAIMIVRAWNGVWADFNQFGRILELPGLGWMAAWIFWTVTFGIGEETGWRGCALPRLQKDRSALSATLILCVLWAFWHVPMFFYKENYMNMGIGGALGFFFTLLPGTIWLTWLYNSTRGSILMVALWHGAWNTALAGAEGEIPIMMSISIMVAAVLILVVARPAHLSHSDKHTLSQRAALP
jgi:membrane protease YdiL (CAAX protease family)